MPPALPLRPGVYIQPYLDAGAGVTNDALSPHLDEWRTLGIAGVAMHGFPRSLPPRLPSLAKLCALRGLSCLAAFGLDGDMRAKDKGEVIGEAALLPDITGVVLDMEGRWDHGADAHRDAATMGAVLRDVAPFALVIDQPWFAPLSHGVFPWEETARYVDIRAPQVYVNDFKKQFGEQRYAKVWHWYEHDWPLLERQLGASLTRPRVPTIQGYGWRLTDLIDCLMRNPVVLMWCEPWPDAATLRALRAAQALRGLGYDGANAVRLFQAAAGLDVDGIAGEHTLAALGV